MDEKFPPKEYDILINAKVKHERKSNPILLYREITQTI
jgi:hypothetical protein